MQWSRVKSILIVILLLVDGFLFFNIAGKYLSSYYRAAENAHNMIEILTGRGIEVAKSFSLPKSGALPVLQVDRSRSDEDNFAYGLLGDAEKIEQQDGSTVIYQNDKGTVEWRDGGYITANFTPSNYEQPQTTRETETIAKSLLEATGVSASLEWMVDEKVAMVVFPTAGVSVFNRGLHLMFGEDTVMIQGCWTFGIPYITTSGNYVTFTATDALFNFVSKNEVGQIKEMELGFLLSESGGGRIQMIPGWRIDTDAGSFFVDSLKKTSISL